MRLPIILAAICVLPILLYVPFLNEPFERDEGLHAAIARLILDGDLPYRDGFDVKPPMTYGWYALSFLVFGQHVWAPRLVAAVLESVTTLLVYVQGRLLFSKREALLAALAFALSIGLARFGTNANTEYFMLLPLVGGLVTFTLGHRTQRQPWFLFSGVLNGIAVMTKEVSAFNVVFLILWTLYPPWRRGALDREHFVSVALLLAGCGLIAALAVLPFVVLGAFGDLWDSSVVFTVQYVGAKSALQRLVDVAVKPVFPFVTAGPWITLSLLGSIYLVSGRDNRWGWLVAGWLAAGAISIVFVGKYFPHYYVHLFPALSLMVPLGVRFLRDRWHVAPGRALAFIGMVCVLAAGAVAINAHVYLRDSPDGRHLSKFADDPRATWQIQSRDLAQYVADNTSPEDTIYNLGFESELYFYADRRSPTRYLYDRAFVADESRIEQALQELKDAPPAFVIDSARYEDVPDIRYDRSAFDQFLRDRYQYLGKMYYADVYRLRAFNPT